jgi:hypothetical protein
MRINIKIVVLCFGAIIAAFAVGCEDVIKIDLKNVEPRLVIEGIISDQPEQSWFVITKTANFYESNLFPMISGASIVVSDDNGWVDTLIEIQTGVYTSSGLIGEVGRTYNASVTIDSVTYTAASYIPDPIIIDSIRTEYQEGGGFGSEEDEGYRLHVFINDPPGTPNFGRIKITVNDSLLSDYYLYDDDFTDGNNIDYNYFDQVFQENDTLIIQYVSMDSVAFDYFRTVASVVASEDGNDDEPVAPANPITNWSNDALGYFGAFSVNIETLMVVGNR